MNVADQLLSIFYAHRSYRNHHRRLVSKLEKLRAQGRFKQFPKGINTDVVSTYPILCKETDRLWFDYFYSLNGVISDSYVPLRLYYLIIEPTLNHRLMMSTIKDKNFYELFYGDQMFPSVFFRRIKGFMYDSKYRRISSFQNLYKLIGDADRFILKASLDSGSGQSIYVFQKRKDGFYQNETKFDEKFLSDFKIDFVAQEFVVQHEYFSKFNPSSNNTIRVLTYRSVKDDTVHVLHSMLRIGATGAVLDHDNHGGVSLSVDGLAQLSPIAYDSNGRQYEVVNGLSLKDQSAVPYYQNIIQAAVEVAEKTYYGRLLALDYTVSLEKKVMLLDINCWRNGITQYQLSNGSLFNQFTSEVMEFCSKKPGFNVIRIPVLNKSRL